MSKDRDDNRMPENDDEGGGYCRPPKKHQFKKGKSGNPKGRPKGAKGLKTDLKEVLAAPVTVSIGGKEYTGSRQKITLVAMAMRAVMGEPRSAEMFVKTILNVLGPDDEGAAGERLTKRDEELLQQLLNYTEQSDAGTGDD
ncbi:MAG: DUF5681 domain-containing protein [Pseudomonadota bacterium]